MSGALSSLKSKGSAALDRVKTSVGMETKNSQDASVLDDVSEMCPQLTYQQRMIGFGTCFVVGYLITFSSFNYFVDLIEGRPVPFVMIYTLGNVISLFSSMFLCGPKRQFKNMFDKKRKVVTIVYLSTLLLSIIICFIPFDKTAKLLVLVVLLIIQCCASIWYSLSYIPFARRTVKKCFKNSFGGDETA